MEYIGHTKVLKHIRKTLILYKANTEFKYYLDDEALEVFPKLKNLPNCSEANIDIEYNDILNMVFNSYFNKVPIHYSFYTNINKIIKSLGATNSVLSLCIIDFQTITFDSLRLFIKELYDLDSIILFILLYLRNKTYLDYFGFVYFKYENTKIVFGDCIHTFSFSFQSDIYNYLLQYLLDTTHNNNFDDCNFEYIEKLVIHLLESDNHITYLIIVSKIGLTNFKKLMNTEYMKNKNLLYTKHIISFIRNNQYLNSDTTRLSQLNYIFENIMEHDIIITKILIWYDIQLCYELVLKHYNHIIITNSELILQQLKKSTKTIQDEFIAQLLIYLFQNLIIKSNNF